MPWIVGGISSMLLVMPEYSGMDSFGLTSLAHWHHAGTFHYFSWHALMMVLFCGLLFHVFFRRTLRLRGTFQKIDLLRFYSRQDKSSYYIVDSDVPHAFTMGLFRPRCYMTTALIKNITERENAIVELHENAHARHFDPLKKWLFAFLSSFFPNTLNREINKAMELAMEQCADEEVLKVVQDRSLIAKTMLKITRLSLAHASREQLQPSCNFVTQQLDERVRYLLSENKGRAFPIGLLICFSALLILASVFSVDALHHAIEKYFTH